MNRAYHFVSLHYGLEDLQRKRLKISRLDDLNDPFELWAIAQPNAHVRQALRETKKEMARDCGLLCFSLDWSNPVLWSHYADRHRGIALGFDVSEHILKPVVYRKTRPILKTISPKVADWLLQDVSSRNRSTRISIPINQVEGPLLCNGKRGCPMGWANCASPKLTGQSRSL